MAAVVVDAQDVALMPGKASVEVKCGLTSTHIPNNPVNLELNSGSENVELRLYSPCIGEVIASYPTNMCLSPTILMAFTLEPPLSRVVT